ncbi:hypothetical protein EC991_010614 [Linnemannia zychae]|nr:hypothetical protein EC991_010614 [Linnemannia zychae]
MTPTDYLINIISSLPKLSHIHLMPSSFELVLPALARGLLPTIRSYVYSNGDMNALDNLVPLLSSPCTTLESLRILTPIPIRHLRSILSIFPALKSLEIRYCEANPGELPLYAYSSVTSTPGGNTTTSNMDPIIHTGIERISFLVIYGLLDAGVQFPNLKRISQIGEVQHVRQLLFILRSFPTLEHLEIRTLGGQDSRRESKQSIKKEDGGPRLKSLVIQAHQPRPRTMTRILATMPNLVRLELRNITLDTLTQLSTAGNYLHLQYVRFNLSKPYYKETNQLFVNCPNLKSIQGLGIAVWAEDMIQEPLWTCLGLQKFHCEIHGVPRLSQDEEELLLEKGIDLNSSNNYYDHHDNIQQIVEQHQHSLLIQRRVYQQLARLTNLRYLDVGFPSRRYRKYAPSISIPTSIALGGYGTIRWYGRPVPDTLSFSLAYALDELKTLQRLDTFGFKAVNHQIGEGELQWMARHWRFLKTVYGLDAHKDGVLCDKKADALGKRLEELIPGVKLKVFRYQDSFDDEAFF